MPTLLLLLLVVLVSFSAGAQTGPQPDCSAPPTSDGWQVASPDVVGLDPKLLCAIGPHFKTWTTANVHSVLVVRHDKLVYEQCFAGDDQKLGRAAGIVTYDATTKHDVRSIEKSVAALVLGIVIKQGRIAGIDQPVLQQFPEYADLGSSQKDQITLRHLLTMSQGLAWNEDRPYSDPANSEYQMDISPNPLRYALSPPVVAPPGTVWNYSTGSATILALLRKATGQSLDVLVRTELFEPLGISDYGGPSPAWRCVPLRPPYAPTRSHQARTARA